MTREQYEKLKEYIETTALAIYLNIPALVERRKELEKEFNKLMFPEGNEG